MEKTFTTTEPVELHVELGSGHVTTTATSTTQTVVEVTGPRADEFDVTASGRRVAVIAPKGRFFGNSDDHHVRVVLPTGSSLVSRTGSADLEAIGGYGRAELKSGSGDIAIESSAGPAAISTGSGDIHCDRIGADLRVKSGSGDVEIDEAHGTVGISTGSGDVALGRTAARVVVKTGSGDLEVDQPDGDVTLTTASGDLAIGQARKGAITARTASGDVHIGIVAGTPVWTDISSTTGRVSSNLTGAGKPAAGQDHVELRAHTVSGDIRLEQA